MGGDEFLILLTDSEERDADAVYVRIKSSLEKPVPYEGIDLVARASIGRASLGEDGRTPTG